MTTTTLKLNLFGYFNESRILTILFAFCMFSTGASGLVNEYVLATITTYILGNSIEQFSIIIASMMLMMGLSGWVQEKISDDNLIEKFMGIEIIMAVLGGFAPLAIYAAFGYMTDHFLLIQYFFVLSIGFLIGFEIPIVMRIIDQHGVGIKTNLKIVYAFDYIGAFAGAIIWVEFLLKNFPLTEISFLVAGSNFIIASITILYFLNKGKVRARKTVLSIISIVSIALVFGYANNRSWSISMEQKFYDCPIIHSETSKYQHITVTECKNNGDIRTYLNGATQYSSLDEVRYHDFLVHPAMAMSNGYGDVLFMGGGDGLGLREALKYNSVKSVTLVDLDPAMVQFSANNPIMRKLNKDSFYDARVFVEEDTGITKLASKGLYLETGKVTPEGKPEVEYVAEVAVYNLDADRFISKLHGKKWDTIIIDFPDPGSVELSKLYSREFFKKLKWHMHEDTMIAIQSTSPYHAKEAYLAIGNTMKDAGLKVLPYRQNIPSFGDWGYYLAWNSDVSEDQMKARLKAVKNFAVETEFITPDLMNASFVFGKGELVASIDCINTLMQPCLLDLYTDYSWKND